VVERPRVGHRCLNTHCYWRPMLDKNGDRAGSYRGISGTLKGKGWESVMSILVIS
jgi:hypothetical protein